MSERHYCRKCGNCRQKAMAIATVPYTITVDHDGRKYEVYIPNLSVPKCGNCQAISIDHEADEQIDTAFRKQAGLLTPEQIRAGRENLGLNQQEFADWFGIAVSTLSRWETGAQIQQRIMNDHLRAFFDVPQFREYLKQVRNSPSSPPTSDLTPVAAIA
jgi:putative zinc finger/helix-turn-helix YgiT family protein